jgi:kynurenine formamidase
MDAGLVQSDAGGIREHSVDTIAPILRRGVLLDIAGQLKLDALPTDFAITPEHLEAAARVEIQRGDVVLLRTGWARYWNDAARYITGGSGAVPAGPGPELEGARWLSSRGVFAAGSDTVAFEKVPAASMPVHVHLLVESGIHIIEALNLDELARDRIYEFVFVAAPLKIRGGTGSPIRPLGLC